MFFVAEYKIIIYYSVQFSTFPRHKVGTDTYGCELGWLFDA